MCKGIVFWKTILLGMIGLGIVSCMFSDFSLRVHAAYSIVSSPDGAAWTVKEELPYTDHYLSYGQNGNRPSFWYPEGTTVTVGEAAEVLEPGVGQHVYTYRRMGEIPLWKWEVSWSKGRCIHNGNASYWHGMRSGTNPCQNAYFSGWKGYCSDCGQTVTNVLIYMSGEAAGAISSIDTGKGYFFHCPTCGHLENQCDRVVHNCQAISANQYKVIYEKNGTFVRNHMEDSLHMYDNVTLYEGNEVVPNKKLRTNMYQRDLYHFVGWNTKADGSGTWYQDGQEIFNLCVYDHHQDGEKGEVHLYAQWELSSSALVLDPNGGDFTNPFLKRNQAVKNGDQFKIQREKGGRITIEEKDVIPPVGYQVSFSLNGGHGSDGRVIPNMTAKKHLAGWELSSDFKGKLSVATESGTGRDYTYLFRGPEGHTDTIKALYESEQIFLPDAEKENANFGGWYLDPACTRLAGGAGDQFTPTKDTILYAKWTELALRSKVNYTACNGCGAVDLTWQQMDSSDKIYRLYRSDDGEHYSKIQSVDEQTKNLSKEERYVFSGTKKTYTVEENGFYLITAYGAAGQDFGTHKGGAGGMAQGKFYLEKGDVLTVTVAGQKGYNGGGLSDVGSGKGSSAGGSGGGASTVSLNGSYLVIAAGGGGASTYDDGLPGGGSGSKSGFFYGETSKDGGGGAGYRGGLGAKTEYHSHTQTCAHQHTSDCYTTGVCGGSFKVDKVHVKDCRCDICENVDGTYSYMGYALRCYGAIPGSHCEALCEQNHVTPGHCVYDYYYTCTKCGDVLIYKNMPPDMQPVACEKVMENVLSCGYTNAYVCGYEQGALLSHSAAEGGDNFVADKALTFSMSSKVQEGDGLVEIRAESVGYTGEMKAMGVEAYDLAPPQGIDPDSFQVLAKGEDQVMVSFTAPEDEGTRYWFMVESTALDSGAVCKSNQTSNQIITGVMGYYYRLDSKKSGKVTSENADNKSPLTKEEILCTLSDKDLYLHVAALDLAGNLGETAHIRLSRQTTPWTVDTSPLKVSGTISGKDWASVYEAGEIYYVRADGKTPFLLQFESYLKGDARENYQIDQQIFRVETNKKEQTLVTILPLSNPYDIKLDLLDPLALESRNEGDVLLAEYPYVKAQRQNESKNNLFQKAFTISADLSGQECFVWPGAGTASCYSTKATDRMHGIKLMPDGEAPIVTGVEGLEHLKDIPKDQKILIDLKAYDALSGLASFRAVLSNTHLHYERTITSDESGRLLIELEPEDGIRQGDLTITLEAVDHVGNRKEWVYGVSDLSLETKISRILEPHDPIFKGGESGLLSIHVEGYVDRLEILFPKEMMSAFEISYTDDLWYAHDEEIPFMVPIDLPAATTYPITVRAFKQEEMLEEIPTFFVSGEGSVLGELRTRLR